MYISFDKFQIIFCVYNESFIRQEKLMSTMAAPTSTFSMSMDEDLKKNFEAVCLEMGLSASAAVTVFATQVVRERRIPFTVSADPFWNKATQRRLEHSYAQIKAGKMHEHGLTED